MENTPFISVICPVYNEEAYIQSCMDCVEAQTYPQNRMEVFFVDGHSTDRTRKIISRYIEGRSGWHLLDNPHQTVPYALNMAIRQSKGEVIVRIDAHSRYPTDYLAVLVEHLITLKADNVGGVWNTLPDGDSARALAIAIACSHKFGVGAALYKTGTDKVCKTDTVPYGCFPKEVFERLGLFDEELARNQDDEFNGRITQAGGGIYVLPQVVIDYYARRDLRRMFKTYFQYGLFKPLVNKKLKRPSSWRQFAPVLFVLGLMAGLPLAVFFPMVRYAYLGAAVLYVSVAFYFGVRQAVSQKRFGLAFYLPWAFFLLHFSYGLGYWTGLLKLLAGKKFKVKSSREHGQAVHP